MSPATAVELQTRSGNSWQAARPLGQFVDICNHLYRRKVYKLFYCVTVCKRRNIYRTIYLSFPATDITEC
jgi:hypothetical protein